MAAKAPAKSSKASKGKTSTKTAAAKPAKAKAASAKASAPAAEATHAPAHTASGAVGFLDVATVPRRPLGLLALILNVIPGGVGSILAGAKTGAKSQIVKGVIQLVLVWTLLVWVWSVVDGVRMFRRSTA